MKKSNGKIIISAGLNVWNHELRTAEALAKAGYTVEFVPKSEVNFEKTADTLIDGSSWEFKSPTANRLKAVERNLKRARWQSANVVFDSRRMRGLPDSAIMREVQKQSKAIKGIQKVLYINKHGSVIDIQ